MVTLWKVKRDEKGKVLEKRALGKFARLVNEATEQAEIVTASVPWVYAFYVDYKKGVLQAEIAIGGMNAAGEFVKIPDTAVALVSIHRAQNPDIWRDYVAARRVWDLNAVLGWFHQQKIFRVVGKNQWEMDDLESETETEPIADLPIRSQPPVLPGP